MATVPGKRAVSDPDLRDRLYELLEHDHLPHSVGSRFAQAIVAIIVLDVLAMILASVPEFDAGFGWLFTAIEIAAVVAFALEYLARLWSVVGHSLRAVHYGYMGSMERMRREVDAALRSAKVREPEVTAGSNTWAVSPAAATLSTIRPILRSSSETIA